MIKTYKLLSYKLAGPSLVRYLIFESVFGKYTWLPSSEKKVSFPGTLLLCFHDVYVSRKQKRSRKSLFSLRVV